MERAEPAKATALAAGELGRPLNLKAPKRKALVQKIQRITLPLALRSIQNVALLSQAKRLCSHMYKAPWKASQSNFQ